MTEPQQNHQDFRKTRQIVLTPEDKAIIKECRDESFYYRCLPLSIVLGVGARYLQYAGILKGKYLGIMGALATGYFAGKVSYIPVCRKKFLERAPNTEYGRLFTTGGASTEGYFPENTAQQPYKPLVNNNSELDDSKRPSLDREVAFKHDYEIEEETQNNSQKSLSYDEMRRKNREQYQQRSTPETDRRQYSRPDDRPPSKLRDIDYGTKSQGKKNKYGDLMESED